MSGFRIVRRLDDDGTLEPWDQVVYETRCQALAALDGELGSDHGPWEPVEVES